MQKSKAKPDRKTWPAKGRVTVKDIAKALDVSVATVSRALSNDPTIADKTRERVLKKADEMGYSPNLFARGLITQRSRIAALFVSNITNPFYPEVVVKLTRRLQALGLHTMLFTSDGTSGVDEALPLLTQYNPDIAIVLAATMSSETVKKCVEGRTPVILFNRYVSGANVSAVCCDNYSGGRLVAETLAGAGHKAPAYISGLDDASTNVDRLRGFRDGCAAVGLPEPAVISGRDFTYEAGYIGMKELFAGKSKPDAVFCGNDIIAIGAMDAARRELGLSIPDDVSVIGFDDIAMASWPSHELTTVRQPMNAMIDEVIIEINRLLSQEDSQPQQRFLPGRLMVRTSMRLKEDDAR
ncbi:MAG: LacI family DNA-binding transcriptional regulator [Rhodobiaceae bacterium]|nr:LacI family DNA-binding transcriptional regulator [Rhodobiaceae bacterium]MCC0012791.1 LacI family DNA-binding transcriptional regulator [Rhodobiaceae bacterium]MCC0051117.1 LacI family DNA-binding transcriptional regulator [Rhodobiaceae bacterium]MCC0060182.1 LacI family DNA-binding transcriptional regulator [Rhodobiaceae bacterium]